VIFTDALNMQAIAAMYPASTAARMAKAAGADVVLPLGTLDEQIAVAAALCDAVAAGELPVAAFEATAHRLDALRRAYNITSAVPPFAAPDAMLYDEALTIARKSITVVHGSDVLPLAPHTRLALIDCLLPRFSLVEEAYARAETLNGLVSRGFPNVRAMTVGAEPTDGDVDRALALARQSDAVLLITRNAALSAERTRFVQALSASPTPVIHVAAGLPYDAGLLGSAAATVLTYGDPDVSLAALVDVVAGAATPQGRAPVTLSRRAAEGTL
jgi:beta-N-acetylhexosaminidase